MIDDSESTLRQGVERLCMQNAAFFSERDTSPEAQEFFRCHDTAHVVFGCDTSLFGEGALKLFTIFGTTLGFWKHVFAYREVDAFTLFRQYGGRHIAKNGFLLILNVPRIVIRARQMRKPWPWSDHEEYLDKSIIDIRNEYRIRVVRRP